jgi:two-component system NtrC family sensor kinase
MESKILIIDDDPVFRKTLSDILRAKGYIPIEVARGKTALKKAHEEKPAVALIDVNLRDIPGLDVMKEIKASSPGTECIVLTGSSSQDSAIQAVNIGAYSYLKKPYDVNHLLLTIQRAIEKQTAQRALRESVREKATILESLAELVSYLDTDLRIVWANHAAAASVDRSPEQLIGRHCHDIWHRRKTPCKGCPVLKALKTGQPHEGEMTTPDGRVWWIRGYPVTDGKEEVIGVVETILEVTARKQAEEALKESEEKYRLLFTTASEGILILNMRGTVQDANPQLLQICGFEREEIVGKNILRLARLFRVDRRQVLAKFKDFLDRKLVETDWLITTKRSKKIDIRVFPSFITKDGRGTGISTIITDITEQKKAEKALRESEAKFRNLAEQSPNMIFIHKRGQVVYANKRCEEMMGYSKKEFYAPDFNFFSLIAPEYIDFISENYAKHMKGEDVAPYEYALITKERKRIAVIMNPKLILYEGDQALLGIVTDITELKRTEEALRREHDLVTRITETSPAGVVVVTCKGKISFANSMAEKVLGLKKEEITQRSYNDPEWNITDFDGRPFPDEQLPFRRIMNTGKPIFDVRHAIQWPDGKRILLSINAAPLLDQSGRVDGMVATVENITERIQAEEALAASELRYRRLFEQNLTAVYRTTLDGCILDCNRAFAHLLGYTSRDEMMKIHTLDLHFNKNDRDVLLKKLVERDRLTNHERRLKRKDGQPVWILENLLLIEEPDGTKVIQGTGIDITDRKRTEEVLIQSEERFKSLYENAMIGLYRTTPDGSILMANPTLIRMLGFSSFDELTHRNLEQIGFSPAYSRTEFKKRIEHDGEVVGLESAWTRRDGSTLYVRESAKAFRNDMGQIMFYEGTVEDITERHKAEAALRESEERYHSLFDRIPVGLYRSTAEGQPLDANQAFLDIMGYPNLKAIRQINTADTYVHAEDRQRFQAIMNRDGRVSGFEAQLRRGNGQVIWARISARAIRDSGGRGYIYEGSIEDMTAQKEADEKLKDRERFLQNVFDGIQDGISVLDHDLNIIRINQWMEQMYASEMPLLGKKCYEAYHNRDKPCSVCPTLPTLETGVPHTEFVPYVSAGKPSGWLELSSFPLENDEGVTIGVIEHVKDITERRRAEMIQKVSYDIANAVHTTEDLQELFGVIRKSLGTIVDTTNFFIALYDRKTDTITLPYFIDEQDEFQSFPAEKTLTAYVIRNEKPLIATREDIDALTEAGTVESIGTHCQIWLGVPLKTKDEIIGALVVQDYENKDAYSHKDLELLQFVSSQIGLSIERKRGEDSLRESEERYRRHFENVSDVVFSIDPEFRILNVSPSVQKVLGYTPEELMHRNFQDIHLLTPNSFQQARSDIGRILAGEQIAASVYELVAKDGKTVIGEISAAPLTRDGTITAIIAIARDITDRRHLQEQLLQSEKMSALGQLISGVAHELNNPMTGVLGFSQLLLSSSEVPEKAKQTLEKIYQEAERARKIVQNLLTFARQRKPEKRTVHINDILNRTIDFRAYEMKVSNIEVVRNFDPHLPTLWADEHQLQQVFMNIIMNAEQAMLEAHGKGRLEIHTHGDRKRKSIRITVSDDGPGISDQDLSKIFDPFFTTKPVGRGTGLGLSISFSIIEEHGGQIRAESKHGHGATFIVEFPVVQEAPEQDTDTRDPTKKLPAVGGKNILVVDDEIAVVDLVRAALEREGHKVMTAYDGDSAIQKIKKERLDAIVSDLKMPGKDGVDIYTFCKEHKPKLKKRFLFFTGDIISPLSLRFLEENSVPYISKPFDIKNLISSVNRLLYSGD